MQWVRNADFVISHCSMDNQAPKSLHLTANRYSRRNHLRSLWKARSEKGAPWLFATLNQSIPEDNSGLGLAVFPTLADFSSFMQAPVWKSGFIG
jgi:hypothetical protein